MPSKVAVPYRKAWVMTPTFASAKGTNSPPNQHTTLPSRGRAPVAVSTSPPGFWVSMVAEYTVSPDASFGSPPPPDAMPAEGVAARSHHTADGQRDEHEIGHVEHAADEERAAAERLPAHHRQEDDGGRQEGDPGRRERHVGTGADDPRSRGEEQGEDGGDARLEHHRSGDVAHRQRVLALAHPDDAVELLGQLGGDGRDDQREDGRVDRELLRKMLDGVHEEDRADEDQPECGED